MTKTVRKAVFPVAGLGTRFLPATKAMPKEMLPIVDKPLIQYAVEEARNAGIEEFIFVTGRAKAPSRIISITASNWNRSCANGARQDSLDSVLDWMPAAGSHLLYPSTGAVGARTRGVVRAELHRRGALRGPSGRRPDLGENRVSQPDGRGVCDGRRQHGGRRGGSRREDRIDTAFSIWMPKRAGWRRPGASSKNPRRPMRRRISPSSADTSSIPSCCRVLEYQGRGRRQRNSADRRHRQEPAIERSLSTASASRGAGSTAAARSGISRPIWPMRWSARICRTGLSRC